MIENRIAKYDNVLCVFEKDQEDEMGRAGEHREFLGDWFDIDLWMPSENIVAHQIIKNIAVKLSINKEN